jgi:phospholipase/carboxylesterase
VSDLNLIHQTRPALEGGRPAPAVIMVHGWLGSEKVMWAFERALPPGAFVVSVRAPFEAGGGYGWALPGDPGSTAAGLEALRAFVERLPSEYPVDPARRVAIGFSQGAALAGRLLLSRPELLAGAALLAGFLPEAGQPWAAPGRLAGKRVFIAHGTEDTTVPLADAEQARAVLQACDAVVTYCTDPAGHKVGPQGMRALKTWLAETI